MTRVANGVMQAMATPMALAAPSGHPTRCSHAQFKYAAGWVGGQEPGLGRYMTILEGGEPGLLGPSYLWVGIPRFPGSGFPLTSPNRSGLPPLSRPKNVLLFSSPRPQRQAPGGCYGPASHSGSPGGGEVGRTPGFPPPSFHPREKFLRGPLRHWVPKITLRGKGGCEGRGSGRSAASSCGVLQVPVESKPKDWGGRQEAWAPTNPWGPS